MPVLELDVTRVVVGGDGMAREPSGRVVFVTGALPGERVRARIIDAKRDFARASVVDVLDPSLDRTAEPCPHVAEGCGGCSWQHVAPSAQRHLKAGIVADSLRRAAHIEVTVDPGPELPAEGYRTTLQGVAAAGRFGLHRHHEHEVVPLRSCLVAHPLVDQLVQTGRFPDGPVVLRAGPTTGERLVVVDGGQDDVAVPDGVRVVSSAQLRAGRRAWFHDEVVGRRWRISARSFFQARPDGAAALVEAVRAALSGPTGAPRRLLDLYSGVGLFSGAIDAEQATAVESGPSAVADARVNLRDRSAKVVRADVERWHPAPADAVIADPPRSGLGRAGVRTVSRSGADRLALISCDAAALGRDAHLLSAAGWYLTQSTLVDMFPQTPHVEVVSRFERENRDARKSGGRRRSEEPFGHV